MELTENQTNEGKTIYEVVEISTSKVMFTTFDKAEAKKFMMNELENYYKQNESLFIS